MEAAVMSNIKVVGQAQAKGARPVPTEFFLARQPILNRNQDLVGYELLFRHADVGHANFTTDLAATASVISHASQLGLEKVIGDSLGFLNVDAAVLMSDIFQFLPREKIILEILETMEVTPELLARIAELVQDGFRFALDDVVIHSEGVRKLMPLVEIIKLDLKNMPLDTLIDLVSKLRRGNKKLLAEKVETLEQFKLCLDLGFDYFQGYYFAKPIILIGKKLSPSQMTITKLMTLVRSDADNNAIERLIKADASVGLNLLLLANTVAVGGARKRIDSLSQALLFIGRAQLQRWLQIMLYVEPSKRGKGMGPLLMLATTRGKLLELIAQKMQPDLHGAADTAFTVGIMSLMDTLFSMPMAEILDQIAVTDEVSDALLARAGRYGEMLKVVEYVECTEEAEATRLSTLRDLELSGEDLHEMGLTAFAWSNEVIKATFPSRLAL